MPDKNKKDFNKVIDNVANAAKKTVNDVSKTLNKETVKKTVGDIKDKVEDVSKTLTKENVKKTVDNIRDKVEDIVDSGEKIVAETTKNVKKKILNPELFIEHVANQVSYDDLKKKVYAELETKTDMLKVKTLKLYFKVEEYKVYCVINEEETIIVEL